MEGCLPQLISKQTERRRRRRAQNEDASRACAGGSLWTSYLVARIFRDHKKIKRTKFSWYLLECCEETVVYF